MSVGDSATSTNAASGLTSAVAAHERLPSLVASVQAPVSSATVAATASAANTSTRRATVRGGGGVTGGRGGGGGKEGGGQAGPRLPSICHHLKRRSQCVQCYDEGTGGSTICKHRKQKYACRSCFDEGDTATKSLCEHRLIRIKCKICTPVRKEVKAYRPRVNLEDLAANLKKEGCSSSAGSSRATSRLREPVMPGDTAASSSNVLPRPSNMINVSSFSAFTALHPIRMFRHA
ncbi:hypothetical protein BC830DRAFT_709799 [Chytriomyces sp. MP71]|nr:hypothetical protein BC830DRAFT_709799 [Chytriomyces sp. MP71]